MSSDFPPVLDACCGPRKFWFDQRDARCLFVDHRREDHTVVDQTRIEGGTRRIVINPDMVADFRCLPFADNSFDLVVFDPPHIKANRTGKKSRMAINYGTLGKNWKADLCVGFGECFRVLRPRGTLIFKWAETNIKLADVLALAPEPPLFGNRMPKLSGTHWCVFMKGMP